MTAGKTIALTGATGFLGGALTAALQQRPGYRLIPIGRHASPDERQAAMEAADFVIHLAGVMRSLDPNDFVEGNQRITRDLVQAMERAGTAPTILFSSTIRAAEDTLYGRTKRAGEDELIAFSDRTGATVAIFRFAQFFGRGARPHDNSVVATILSDAAHGIRTALKTPEAPLALVRVDHAAAMLLRAVENPPQRTGLQDAPPDFDTTVGEIARIAARFSEGHRPSGEDALEAALFDAFLGYRADLTLAPKAS